MKSGGRSEWGRDMVVGGAMVGRGRVVGRGMVEDVGFGCEEYKDRDGKG